MERSLTKGESMNFDKLYGWDLLLLCPQQDELERAGAYRVYQDPADLLRYIDEIGVRT
jgi:hypothetical protein